MNENISVEIMTYLLDINLLDTNPFAAHTGGKCLDILNLRQNQGGNIYILCIESAYPLHLACYNEECPNEAIQLLLEKSGDYQLTHFSYMDFNWGKTDLDREHYGGTPLHYYLSRASNVDLGIVKQLVVNSALLLSADDNTNCTPIHILMNNKSIGDLFDVVKYLVETNPSSLKVKDEADQTPLHIACLNENITARTVKLILEAWPDSIHQRINGSALPIHCLCYLQTQMIDKVAIDILQLLLEAHPESLSETVDDDGELPLHCAAHTKSQAFCKVLVDAYPESVKRPNGYDALPFQYACSNGRPETLEYLFKLHPESLHIRNSGGHLPIHEASSNPGENAADIIKFLLRHDPECISKPVVSNFASDDDGCLPLHLVCSSRDDTLWDKYVMELLFDLYPEAILIRDEQGQLPIDIVREKLDELPINSVTRRLFNEEGHQRLQDLVHFLQTQMSYARKARDDTAMRTPDSNGSLPLHRAIRDNEPLGTIKLLVKGNSDAINVPDGNGMLPLAIASEVSTVGVVKYLAEFVPYRLNACDVNKNYPLHHAGRGGNCEVVAYLLETPISSASVSERNSDGMLPIHLFCEHVSKQEVEEDTPEFTETIWHLLTAYPETILNW